jgi:hypothetical protein
MDTWDTVRDLQAESIIYQFDPDTMQFTEYVDE